MITTYLQAMDFLYSRLPMYERVGPPAYKEGLGNITALCEGIGNPQRNFKSIHIAGTNGKGSVSHYLAAILQSAGMKNVGLHTSPHLSDFRERVKVNGKMLSKKEVITFLNKFSGLIDKVQPSFFELSVALAFYTFSECKSAIAVIETGLGGRLDSTNIITPVISVITNISYDHVELLGNTLEKIATEKAGIIKPGVPVIIGESNPETSPVFNEKAKQRHSKIVYADKMYSVVNSRNTESNNGRYLQVDVVPRFSTFHFPPSTLQSGLTALYQTKNIATILAATDALIEMGCPISEEHIRAGIKNVLKLTGFKGRWQVLSRKPLIVADIAHNEAGLREVIKQVSLINYAQVHIVFGMVKDKDISQMLALLPKDDKHHYYFCKAAIPRALPEAELKKRAEPFGLQGAVYPTVAEALNAAKARANTTDLILLTGSAYVVAEGM